LDLVRLRSFARKIPVDLAAFLVISLFIGVTHRPLVRLGMCFNDASWFFHFGKRLLDGDVPYRDYLFQVGPLPIYIDAAFQKIFGSLYLASLYAALFIKILRVFVVFSIARRLTSVRTATLIALFCCFDPLFSFPYHWSVPYANLLISVVGLFLLLAHGSTGRRALTWMFLAGFSAGLMMWARQGTSIMVAVVGGATTVIFLVRKEFVTRRLFVAMWVGFAAAVLLLFAILALQGALGPAIQQLFIDAPAKKGVHGMDAILDPISGGAFIHQRFDPTQTWWSIAFYFLGIPLGLTGLMLFWGSRKEAVTPQSIAVLALPALVILGLFSRYGEIGFFGDLPRTVFTMTMALAVLAPRRLRDWFGLEPMVAFAFAGLPLASDWAMELSNLGRGWGDPPGLLVGAILLPLASSKVSQHAKTILGGLLALVACVHLISSFRQDINPLGNDGRLDQTTFSIPNQPMLRHIRVNEGRRKVFTWLRSEIPKGSTCFIYGNLPVLYTLLECKNPTLIDTTAADFMTVDDADRAMDTLHKNLPDFIIAHELAFMNPSLRIDWGEDINRYSGMNPKVSRSLHVGVRRILDQYEEVGFAKDEIGPELAKIVHDRWDIIDEVRLYRRKKPAATTAPAPQ
jgi:hypothetical protein